MKFVKITVCTILCQKMIQCVKVEKFMCDQILLKCMYSKCDIKFNIKTFMV